MYDVSSITSADNSIRNTQEYTTTTTSTTNNHSIIFRSRRIQQRIQHRRTRRISIIKNKNSMIESHSRRINLNIFSILCIFVIIIIVIVGMVQIQVQVPVVVYGKEIIVTNDWQRVGENDTIPQGVHVKIDLSTGDKFVKLIDDSNDNEQQQELLSTSTSTSTSVVMINDNKDKNNTTRTIINATTILQNYTSSASSDYSNSQTNKQSIIKPKSTIVPIRKNPTKTVNTDDDTDSVINQKKRQKQQNKQNYDFDMMYRTLDQLPIEDKINMGLPESIPPLPLILSNVSTTDSSIIEQQQKQQQQRIEFETKMIQIWEYRQEQLVLVQDTMIADTIKLLKERINSLQSYINNPSDYINYFLNDKQTIDNDDTVHSTTTNDSDDNDSDNDYSVQSNNIISILADLEYQLTDVDMTRDFYTMDGWPLLVSLLHNDVHYYDTNYATDNDTSISAATAKSGGDAIQQQQQIQSIIDQIQTYVAWILGTAVKNTGEFTPYVLDNIVLYNEQSNIKYNTTTPLLLVVDLIHNTITRLLQETNSTDHNSSANIVFILQKKLDKLLYCLGSFLRGNSKAQEQFVSLLALSSSSDNDDSINTMNGSVLLRTICQQIGLIGSMTTTTATNNRLSLVSINYRIQLIQRIIQLITDIVIEVTSTRTKYDHIDTTTGSHNTIQSSNNNTSLIVQSFTDNDWCNTYIEFLNPSNFYFKDTAVQDSSNDNTTSQQQNEINQFKKIIQYSEIILDNIVNTIVLKNYCIDTFTISIDTITSSIQQWIAIWDTAYTKQQQEQQQQQQQKKERLIILDQKRYHNLLQLSDTLMKQLVSSTSTTTTENVIEQQGAMKDTIKSEEL